jgi:hypothetical protein
MMLDLSAREVVFAVVGPLIDQRDSTAVIVAAESAD